jgi:hypothetical protein
MQKEVLAKFSSGQELADFLKSDGGKLFISEPQKVRSPAHRVGAGLFVIVLGFGILASSYMLNFDFQAHQGISVAGVIVLAAGFGLLISAVVTQNLSRKWNSESKTSD